MDERVVSDDVEIIEALGRFGRLPELGSGENTIRHLTAELKTARAALRKVRGILTNDFGRDELAEAVAIIDGALPVPEPPREVKR